MLTQSSLSLEYIRVPVSVKESGIAIDPTSDTVALAFPVEGVAPSQWEPGTWETDATTVPTTYLVRVLVGPSGDVELTAGLYDVWVRISDNPEIPARKAGNLQIV
jgi:hypothetical protein